MKKSYNYFFSLIVFLFTFSMGHAQDDPNKKGHSSDVPYTIVEEMPEFSGGEKEMVSFIKSNLRYPEKAMKHQISGKVYVSFVVDEDGSIVNSRILRGIGGGCDEEALRVVNSMPKWKPGRQGGRIVKVIYNLPIVFKIRTPEEINKEARNDLNNHGVELASHGKYEAAIQQFNSTLSLSESDTDAYVNRGNAKYKMGDTKNACSDWGLAAYYGDKDIIESIEKNCESRIVIDNDTFHTSIFRPVTESNLAKTDTGSSERIYTIAEVMPSFPGGEAAMINFISQNIKYPAIARDKDITGKIFIRFYVNKTGKVSRPVILRGIGGGCDEEALRVIKMMPDWKPGTQNGKPVNVFFNLPIYFSLK